MSDTLEPDRFRLLRHTPMRDLVRGRLTGRLDLERKLAAPGLSQPTRDLIRRVVRRTRLWRIEKADVADELIAHFADGLAAGESADTLIADFGDERRAARLIRRAKRRGRPLTWHLRKWALRAVMVVVGCYLVLVARFFVGRPTVKVDYVARLNEPVLRVPAEQRAWPLYRRALIDLRLVDDPNGQNMSAIGERLHDRNPTDWPQIVAWLDANGDGVELIRQAAARPALGFVYGDSGSQEDAELNWKWPSRSSTRDRMGGSLISVLLPYLNHARTLAYVLEADLRLATERGDLPRVERDYDALLGLAGHQAGNGVLVNALVSIGIDHVAFDALGRALLAHPERFDDASLRRLAHRTARVGGEMASSLLSLDGERMMFDDLVQRIFTDDGNGDGRLTRDALEIFPLIVSMSQAGAPNDMSSAPDVAIASVYGMTNARRDNVEMYERQLAILDACFARPFRDGAAAANREVERNIARLRSSPKMVGRYYLLIHMMPSLVRAAATAERLLATRDGLTTAIALEIYRRDHGGAYPSTLDALVPACMPSVPVDRVTGEPIRFRVVDGRTVIYSVGVDRDDDGGRLPTDASGKPYVSGAALDSISADEVTPNPRHNGDWLLYGEPLFRAIDADRAASATPATTAPTTLPIESY